MFLFFGSETLALSYDEYVSFLSLVGVLAGGHLFSCLVVFQFRKNLIEDAAMRENFFAVDSGSNGPGRVVASAPRAPSPPPTYEEVSKTNVKAAPTETASQSTGPGDGEQPPEYEAALASQWKREE